MCHLRYIRRSHCLRPFWTSNSRVRDTFTRTDPWAWLRHPLIQLLHWALTLFYHIQVQKRPINGVKGFFKVNFKKYVSSFLIFFFLPMIWFHLVKSIIRGPSIICLFLMKVIWTSLTIQSITFSRLVVRTLAMIL